MSRLADLIFGVETLGIGLAAPGTAYGCGASHHLWCFCRDLLVVCREEGSELYRDYVGFIFPYSLLTTGKEMYWVCMVFSIEELGRVIGFRIWRF